MDQGAAREHSPPTPSRRALLRVLAALPASALALANCPACSARLRPRYRRAAPPPGSTCHAFTKNETAKYIEYGAASSLTGPYTITKTGDWAGWGGYREGNYYCSDGYDTFATWTAPKALPSISGTARHFTVIKETVSGGPSLAKNVTRSFQSANCTTRQQSRRRQGRGARSPGGVG